MWLKFVIIGALGVAAAGFIFVEYQGSTKVVPAPAPEFLRQPNKQEVRVLKSMTTVTPKHRGGMH